MKSEPPSLDPAYAVDQISSHAEQFTINEIL